MSLVINRANSPFQRIKAALSSLILIVACVVSSSIPASASSDKFFAYDKIRASRMASRGRIRSYEMYIPKRDANSRSDTFPLVVLVHGFMRKPKHMRHNAEYLAERGIFVLVPEMDQILWGYEKRGRNMDEVTDLIKWFLPRASDPKDKLYGAFDPHRVGMLGHSSGGPICIEVIIDLQKQGIAIDSMMLPDGIVWPRTMERLAQLQPLNVFSVRSEPAVCNQHASVLGLLEKLPFPYQDFKVNGSKHCDPENPTNWGCKCICGKSKDEYRNVFVRLMYVYFKDRLKAPSTPDSHPTLEATLRQFETNKKITRGIGPSTANLEMTAQSQ